MDLFASLNKYSQIQRLSPGCFLSLLAKRIALTKQQRDAILSSATPGMKVLDIVEMILEITSLRNQPPHSYFIICSVLLDWLRSSTTVDVPTVDSPPPPKRIEKYQHRSAPVVVPLSYKCSNRCLGLSVHHNHCLDDIFKPSASRVKIVPRKSPTTSRRPGDSANAVIPSSSGKASFFNRRRQRVRFAPHPLRIAKDTPMSCPFGEQHCTICVGLWSRFMRCTNRVCTTSQEHVDGSHPSYNAAELRYIRSRHPQYWQDKYRAKGMELSTRPSSPAITSVISDDVLDVDADLHRESCYAQQSSSLLLGQEHATRIIDRDKDHDASFDVCSATLQL